MTTPTTNTTEKISLRNDQTDNNKQNIDSQTSNANKKQRNNKQKETTTNKQRNNKQTLTNEQQKPQKANLN